MKIKDPAKEEVANIYYIMGKYLHIPPSEVDKLDTEIVFHMLEHLRQDIKEEERALRNAK